MIYYCSYLINHIFKLFVFSIHFWDVLTSFIMFQISREQLKEWIQSNLLESQSGSTLKHDIWKRLCDDHGCNEEEKQPLLRQLLDCFRDLQWNATTSRSRGKKKVIGVIFKGKIDIYSSANQFCHGLLIYSGMNKPILPRAFDLLWNDCPFANI